MMKLLAIASYLFSVAVASGAHLLKGSDQSRNLEHGPCADDEKDVILQVKTDIYPYELSWTVSNPDTGEVLLEVTYGPEDLSKYFEYAKCVPKEACLLFDIKDIYKWHPFIKYDGFYNLIVDDEVVVTSFDNEFDDHFLYYGYYDSSEKLLISCDDFCRDSSKASVLFEYFPDMYSIAPWYENAVRLTDLKAGVVLVDEVLTTSEFLYNKTCIDLSTSCYLFEITDSYGEGIYALQGYYQLKVDGDVIATNRDDFGGDFGFGESVEFGDACM